MGEAAKHRGKIERVVEASRVLTGNQKLIWLTDFRFSQMGSEGSYMSHPSMGERLGMSGRTVEAYRQLFVTLGCCHRIDRPGAKNPGWRPFLPTHCLPPTDGRVTPEDCLALAAKFDDHLESLMPDVHRTSEGGATHDVHSRQVRRSSGVRVRRSSGVSPTSIVGTHDAHSSQNGSNPNGHKAVTASDRSVDLTRDRRKERSETITTSDLPVVDKTQFSIDQQQQRSEGSREPEQQKSEDVAVEVDETTGRLKRARPGKAPVPVPPPINRELPGAERPPSEGTPVHIASAIEERVKRMAEKPRTP